MGAFRGRDGFSPRGAALARLVGGRSRICGILGEKANGPEDCSSGPLLTTMGLLVRVLAQVAPRRGLEPRT